MGFGMDLGWFGAQRRGEEWRGEVRRGEEREEKGWERDGGVLKTRGGEGSPGLKGGTTRKTPPFI